MTRKKLLSLLIFLLLVSTTPNVNKVKVSAAPLSPYIMVVPDKTVNSTLTPGMNYTISIYTDYDGSDVWGWQFTLTFNPNVLEGIEVLNGDLITRTKNTTARFYPGSGFDNTQGTLSLVSALFYYTGNNTAYTTNGPGTLANVTFTVVGIGIANITLGDVTKLKGNKYDEETHNTQYDIIDASLPPGATEIPYGSDHIGHGYFNNIPPIHDVAVIMNYTAVICTDYNGSNICAWQFNLTFNPTILKGVEVHNGNLITTAKHDNAKFAPGTFNNTAGTLSNTSAYFDFLGNTYDTTNGPGTFAYVTFNVIGTGDPNITLGSATQLLGVNRTALPAIMYTITEANIFVTPLTALLGDVVSINVGVANEGNFTETLDVTAYVNNTFLETQTVTSLASGGRTLLTFNWNTTGLAEDNYVITANATVLPSTENPEGKDEDPTDNTRVTLIRIKTVHDVAILNLEIPAKGTIGDFIPINVTVENQGTFQENVNLTIYYTHTRGEFKMANTTNFMLARRPASKIIQVNWNTTGLEAHEYTINATVTIAEVKDEDLSDNTLLETITLNLGHDVKVVPPTTAIPTKVFVGETVTIRVKVQNVGGIDETLPFEVKVTYNYTKNKTKDIGSQQVPSLPVGNSTTLSFTWNTTGVDPNIYPINAEAILETDANPTNNHDMTLVVVAEPIGNITGIVKDTSTGNPIEGATVTAGTYTNTTNADGYYKLSNVLAGNYTVTVSKNGYQTSSQTSIKVIAGQTTSLNFTLTPLPGHITGTVTDASTGNPIEGAQVTAGGHSVSTNATGGYSIELAAGTYNVTVSAEGYESSSESDVNVVAGATKTVDFELTPIQPSNIFLYAAAVIGVIIVIAGVGVAVYLLKGRKKT
jgi:uncharacterized membrane protein